MSNQKVRRRASMRICYFLSRVHGSADHRPLSEKWQIANPRGTRQPDGLAGTPQFPLVIPAKSGIISPRYEPLGI